MTGSSWSQLYDEVEAGGQVAAIPAGRYDVTVDAVRTLPASRLLFVDLKVQAGPEAGKVAQVNLYLPQPGSKAVFPFTKKMAGLKGALAALQTVADGDVEGALDALADALVGMTTNAEITVRSDGDYAGSNELVSTRPVDGAPAPAAVAAPPTPATQPVVTAPAPAPTGAEAITTPVVEGAAPPSESPAPEAAAQPPVPIPDAEANAADAANDDLPF